MTHTRPAGLVSLLERYSCVLIFASFSMPLRPRGE
jgi:hypothetical protein